MSTSSEKRDIYGEYINSPINAQPPAELDADEVVHEAGNNAMPVEAPTKMSPQELEGDMVPELSQDGSRRTLRKIRSTRS